MIFRPINPRWEMLDFKQVTGFVRLPKDRQWFYIGPMKEGIEVFCKCNDTKIRYFTAAELCLSRPSMAVASVQHILRMSVKGKTGIHHFLDFLVGQCERCDRIYWGLKGRHACEVDEYGFVYDLHVPVVDPKAEYERRRRDGSL